MSNELQKFIHEARDKRISDEEIKNRLVAGGWDESTVDRALHHDNLEIPAPPPAAASHSPSHDPSNPISVVQNLSTRGFEYTIMFVALWAVATSIGWMLHQAIDQVFYEAPATYGYSYSYNSSSNEYAFPITVLLVFVPVFIYMFLRLKKAELSDPMLLKDPSRRKLSHITQFVSFIIGAGYLIGFIYSLINGDSGVGGAQSFGELLLHLIVTFVIAGGIFVYYWRDEHRSK